MLTAAGAAAELQAAATDLGWDFSSLELATTPPFKASAVLGGAAAAVGPHGGGLYASVLLSSGGPVLRHTSGASLEQDFYPDDEPPEEEEEGPRRAPTSLVAFSLKASTRNEATGAEEMTANLETAANSAGLRYLQVERVSAPPAGDYYMDRKAVDAIVEMTTKAVEEWTVAGGCRAGSYNPDDDEDELPMHDEM